MSLGSRLRDRRDIKKKTQIEAAEHLGISNVQLSRYESDERKPDPELLAKFADYYETTVDFLLGRTNDPRPNIIKELNRAYYDGGRDWTEEEHQLADAFIEGLRAKRKKQ